MKKRWGAYVYVPVLACLVAGMGMYIWKQQHGTEMQIPNQVYYLDEYFRAETDQIEEIQQVTDQNVLLEKNTVAEPINRSSVPKAEFVLRVVGDQVLVFRTEDMGESYLPTGIYVDELPEETLQEIIAGKEILNEEALYFFLESYSS